MADNKMDEKVKAQGSGGFKEFLWNPNTGQLLGRTGLSWLKITIFYIIFYASLAAFWAVMLAIFYQTLDMHEPKWKLDDSRIGSNPGLGYKPRPPKDNIESTLINLDSSNKNSEKLKEHYINDLKEFIKGYTNSSSGEHLEDSDTCKGKGGKKGKNEYCLFRSDMADSGGKCSETNKFGYDDNRPCIVIKLNRIFDWEPEPYKKAPEALIKILEKRSPPVKFNNHTIFITCEGQDPTSKETMLDVEYLTEGIDFNYFPYRNQPGYKSPFIWVKFNKFASGIVIRVECKAWARNIKHDRVTRKGIVTFELLST